MFRFSLKNLFSRPVRTLLALCGLTVAIAGMVGLFSVADGIESSVAATFGKVPGLTVMQPGAPIPLFSRIPAVWGAEIARLPGVHVVHPEVWTRAHLIEGKPSISPPRFLFGSDLAVAEKLRYSVYREGLKEGRILTAADRGTQHALISRAIADQFKKEVGQTLRVDGRDLEVVGVYECNSLFLDVAIILDIELVRRMGRVGDDSVCNFYVEPDAQVDRDDLIERIKDLFRGRALETWQPTLDALVPNSGPDSNEKPKTIAAQAFLSAISEASKPIKQAASDDDPIEVRSSDDWAREFKRFSADLDIFLLLMTGIGVSIAFVGIVNTMLMSVTERFIEFGILKANGWSNGDVLRLIAFESALLGICGGLVGCLFGWLATLAINAHWPTRIHLYAGPRLLLWSVCFSTVLGVLAGLYPAIRASRMMPMDAIRRG
ncbi:MAG TPA: ABC transporter permease [Planctomycetaceae bacterium]|nr:ABC transporter permease [Planctomycetaceae bacterium]